MKNIQNGFLFMLKIIGGCLLISIAINGLYLPNRMLSGGASGISMLLHLLFGTDTGAVYILINIPLFLVGLAFLPKRFMLFTLFSIGIFSLCLSATAFVNIPTQNPISVILLGGAINGFGNGLIYNAGASTGGTDIISKIVNMKFSLSISTMGFAMNLIIISVSMYFFGIDISVCTLAAMFVSTQVSNYVVEGMNHKRMVLIITEDKKTALCDGILAGLGRGVTVLPAEGAYTGEEKSVLYCVIGVTQVARLKAVVKSIDPLAFITVTETSQVYGNGRGFYHI